MTYPGDCGLIAEVSSIECGGKLQLSSLGLYCSRPYTRM